MNLFIYIYILKSAYTKSLLWSDFSHQNMDLTPVKTWDFLVPWSAYGNFQYGPPSDVCWFFLPQ